MSVSRVSFENESKTQDIIKPSIKIGKKLGEKSGGNQKSAPLGGLYSVTVTDEQGNQSEKTALVKQENNKEKNLIEYAISHLAKKFDKEYAYLFAQVFLVPPNAIDAQQEEKSPYVASVFVAEDRRAKDLWKYVYEVYQTDPCFQKARKRNGHQTLSIPKKRPRHLGTGEPKVVFDTVLPVLFKKYPILKKQFAHIIAMSYWSGDPDKHFGNIMVRFLPDKKTIEGFSSIDFAGGFDWFDWDQILFPTRNIKHGLQPTNHIKEYSRNFRITEEVATVFEQYAKVSNETINTEVKAFTFELAKRVPENDIRALAEKLLLNEGTFPVIQVANSIIDIISKQLTKKLVTKRDEFNKLAFEIRLSGYFVPKNLQKPEEGFICEGLNLLSLKDLLKKHPEVECDKLIFRGRGQEYFTNELKSLIKHHLDNDEKLETMSPMSLIPRLKYALLDIYHLDANSSFLGRVKTIFGWSGSVGSVFKFPFSILKICAELLPAIGEQFFGWASDKCLQILKDPQTSSLSILAAGIALFCAKPLSWFCLLTRLATMRITSPKKSIEQAMKAGKWIGELFDSPNVGQCLGVIFACVSAAMTLVGWCGIAIAVSPCIASLGAKIEATGYIGSKIVFCVNTAVHWLASTMIPQMINTTVLKIIPAIHSAAEPFTIVSLFFGVFGFAKAIKKCRDPEKRNFSQPLEYDGNDHEVERISCSASTKFIFRQPDLRSISQHSSTSKVVQPEEKRGTLATIGSACSSVISSKPAVKF